MRRRRRKKHTPDQMEQQRRGRKIFRVLGRVLLTGIVLAAAMVAMTVFFKVKTISVEGAEQYGSEELIAGMDVQKGDNLYLWNKNRVLSDLMHSFPYLESAQLRRKLPDGLVLTVTECTAAAAVRNEDNTFTYISAGGKVLENNAADGGLPTVLGVTLNAQIGDFLATGTDAHVDAMLNVLENMDAAGLLEKMSFLNLNDLTDVRIGYDKRFDIRAGSLVSGAFVKIFTKDPAYIDMAAYMIRTYSLGVLGLTIQYPFVDGMTGMEVAREIYRSDKNCRLIFLSV